MKLMTTLRSALAITLLTGMATFTTACEEAEDTTTDPSASALQANKRLVEQVYEKAYNGGDTAVVDELLSPSYVNHQVFPGLPADREGIKMVIGSMRAAFPDLDIVIKDSRAEGDMVYVYAVINGTNLGPLQGMEPSGKKVAFETMDSFRLVDGKQVEHWGVTDQLGLMSQLGAMSGM